MDLVADVASIAPKTCTSVVSRIKPKKQTNKKDGKKEKKEKRQKLWSQTRMFSCKICKDPSGIIHCG